MVLPSRAQPGGPAGPEGAAAGQQLGPRTVDEPDWGRPEQALWAGDGGQDHL
jgi:hypothetical protein